MSSDESKNDSIDEKDQLWNCFDDFSVSASIKQFQQGLSPEVPLDYLLSGRGASVIWTSQFQNTYTKSLSLSKVAMLGRIIPINEVAHLVKQIADATLLEQLKTKPLSDGLQYFSTHRINSLVDAICKYLSDSSSADSTFFFNVLASHESLSSNEKILDLAMQLCLSSKMKKSSLPILRKLLEQTKDYRLIQLAEQQLANCSWNDELVYLMVSLMRVQKAKFSEELFFDWYRNRLYDDSFIVRSVLSSWLVHTKSRRAFECLRLRILCNPIAFEITFYAFAFLSKRKMVSRWVRRTLRSNIRSAWCHHILFYSYLKTTATNIGFAYELANEAIRFASEENRNLLIEGLVFSDRSSSEVDTLAFELIEKFPNAPRSFDFACSLARKKPDLCVPWLFDWCETALPAQVFDGMHAIIGSSKNESDRKKAQDLLHALIAKDLLPVEGKIDCLIFLLKRVPDSATRKIAQNFVEMMKDYPHFESVNKLRRLLR